MLLATIFWGVNVAVTGALVPQWMMASGISATRLVGGCLLFLVAPIFIKCQKIEKDSWPRIGAGVVTLAGGGDAGADSSYLPGDCLAIASTICCAFYLFILEKPSHKYKPLSLLRRVFLFAAIPGLLLAPGMGKMPIVHAEKGAEARR